MFARKSDGSWRICYDHRGLNAMTKPMVEQLPRIDALLGRAPWLLFPKFDLAQGHAFWTPELLVAESSVLMRVVNAA